MIFFMGFSLLVSICREEHPACGASSPWPRLTPAFGFGKAGRLAVCPLRFGIHWNALLSGTASADIAPFSPMLPLGVHAGAPAGPARGVP